VAFVTKLAVGSNLKDAALLERRREVLVRAATEVFTERRFDKASVNEIADRCGWSIGSLYRYVSSKEDILVLVCEDIFRRLGIEDTSGATPRERFAAAYGAYCDRIHRSRRQVLLMYREYTQLPADAQRYFRQREREVYAVLAGIVREGVQDGSMACEDPDLFAVDCVMRAHAIALKEWAMPRRRWPDTRALLVGWALGAVTRRE
jgi:TetR/AcrR family transcriptional regulator, cholesterol catabolism regulator